MTPVSGVGERIVNVETGAASRNNAKIRTQVGATSYHQPVRRLVRRHDLCPQEALRRRGLLWVFFSCTNVKAVQVTMTNEGDHVTLHTMQRVAPY